MKVPTLLSAVFLAVACLGGSPASHAQGGHDMKITIYNDGLSCPGGCDAHFVMHSSDNGTANARSPGSTGLICFDAGLTQCMSVMYRGAGPHPRTFDFTPAFFEDACARADLPA